MATYQFEQFLGKIIDPTVEIKAVNDNMQGECSVDIVLKNSAAECGVTLNGFTYKDDTWETTEIEAWIPKKLKEYEV
jgi:hypothetical protein